ncbi:unnamed protein product [Parascedosporium putredinis]|uniref:N-acetyltransferase domain-containing protein n=1 Tax=Parascedosporium putredinis TaxID=1442378 RepID=A0A9P1GUC4_9PEZI|nr:unnamed protein product [Parascedosporium putredinis]CAI7987799.1 unnamed protein product [Parascedosporium putredinis]
MEPHNHMAVRELDLSAYHPTSIVDKINAVPALKTSTVLADEDEKTDALQLVAESVAERRAEAATALAAHPACVAGLVVSVVVTYHYHHLTRGNLSVAVAACSLLLATYLAAAYYLSAGYSHLAQEVIPNWIASGDCRRDMVLAARKDNVIVAALVLTLEPSFTQMSRRRGRHASLRGGRCVIKAWTTAKAHRGQGIGAELLAKAVRVSRDKCGRDAAIGFAKEHAHSTMMLAEIFNGSFRKRELRATKALDTIVADLDGNRKKR